MLPAFPKTLGFPSRNLWPLLGPARGCIPLTMLDAASKTKCGPDPTTTSPPERATRPDYRGRPPLPSPHSATLTLGHSNSELNSSPLIPSRSSRGWSQTTPTGTSRSRSPAAAKHLPHPYPQTHHLPTDWDSSALETQDSSASPRPQNSLNSLHSPDSLDSRGCSDS